MASIVVQQRLSSDRPTQRRRASHSTLDDNSRDDYVRLDIRQPATDCVYIIFIARLPLLLPCSRSLLLPFLSVSSDMSVNGLTLHVCAPTQKTATIQRDVVNIFSASHRQFVLQS